MSAAVRQGVFRRLWRRPGLAEALRHQSLVAGLVITLLLLLVIAAAPLLSSADPNLQDPMASFSPPSAAHPMGADAFGRDLFARVLYGGRTTILASISVVTLGGLAGITLGLIAGYAGGVARFVIMRMVDLLLAFPASCWRWRYRPCSGRVSSTGSWRSRWC